MELEARYGNSSRPERGEVVNQLVARLGIAINLDELERLMKIFVSESDASSDQNRPDALKYRMYLASFLIWLRQRERQSVAGGNDDNSI